MPIAVPKDGTIMQAEIATCELCNTPIASLMSSPWTHVLSGDTECSDPRTTPPTAAEGQ